MAWGRHFDIPLIGFESSSSIDWVNNDLGSPFNTAANPCSRAGFSFPMNFWERLQNTLTYYSIAIQKNYYYAKQDKLVKKIFGSGYPSTPDLIRDIDLLLVNYQYSLDGVIPFTPAVVPVGGLHTADDGTKLSNVRFLNFHRSLLK